MRLVRGARVLPTVPPLEPIDGLDGAARRSRVAAGKVASEDRGDTAQNRQFSRHVVGSRPGERLDRPQRRRRGRRHLARAPTRAIERTPQSRLGRARATAGRYEIQSVRREVGDMLAITQPSRRGRRAREVFMSPAFHRLPGRLPFASGGAPDGPAGCVGQALVLVVLLAFIVGVLYLLTTLL